MSIEEYFGDWSGVVDIQMADSIMKKLSAYKDVLCPKLKDVFKAFRLCSYDSLRVVIIGQEPYNNYRDGKPVATGLAFANAFNTSEKTYSSSLKVLMESVIDFPKPHNNVIFDPSLEMWEGQGVLLLNTALTCLRGRNGVHMLLWRPFITDFLTTLSMCRSHLVYVLMGNDAQSLEPNIDNRNNCVIRCRHPAWYARMNEKMPHSIWTEINKALIGYNSREIKWFN